MKRSCPSVRVVWLVVSIAALGACDNKSSGGGALVPPAGSTSSPVAATVAPAPEAPSASAAAAAANSAWSGTYKSGAGTLSLPTGKDFKEAKWQADDAGIGLGDGPISLSVDGSTGQISGSGEGAIGAVVLTGTLSEGQLTATISRKDPEDRGLIGTAVGKAVGDKIEGTMSLSSPDGSIIRRATFSLAKKS